MGPPSHMSISAPLFFAARIVQSLLFLNPKFPASSLLLWLYRLVCVGPGNPEYRFSRVAAHIEPGFTLITPWGGGVAYLWCHRWAAASVKMVKMKYSHYYQQVHTKSARNYSIHRFLCAVEVVIIVHVVISSCKSFLWAMQKQNQLCMYMATCPKICDSGWGRVQPKMQFLFLILVGRDWTMGPPLGFRHA